MTIDRDRLCKLLGMLGSAHDGEVLNAARLIDQTVRESGKSWSDLLRPLDDPDDQDAGKLGRLLHSDWLNGPMRLQLREMQRLLRAGRLSDADRRFIRLLYRKAVLEGGVSEPG